MQAAGVQSLFPMEKLAVRGYVEVLAHLREILAIRRDLKKRWTNDRPDIFIGVDAPDFNLALETVLRRHRVTTVHVVSPSIWAWRPERARKIRDAVCHMFTLFPFEPEIYRQASVPVTFIGHPLADILPVKPDRQYAREQLRLASDATVIAMLPGSRESELANLADLYVRTARTIAERRPDVLFLAPFVSRTTRGQFEEALSRNHARDLNIQLLFGHAHEALMAANVGLIASGTATLEAALLGCPMVITYRVPRLTFRIMWPKRLMPYVGLPNVLAGEFIVPEFLQDEATADNLSQALLNLLADSEVQRRLQTRFDTIRKSLRQGAAEVAARAIVPLLAR